MFSGKRVLVTATVVVVAGATLVAAAQTGDSTVQWEVRADSPLVNREVLGEVNASVDGVPAEPVHSFVWDGEGSVPVQGSVQLEVDPASNSGEIVATWTDEHGDWEFTQTDFAAPDHANGLRVGSSGDTTQLDFDDPIPTYVYLHGDTTAGGPVLPTVFNLLATWGPAQVTLNGEAFENPFDGPAPAWAAHTMTTVGVRAADGTVRTVAGEIFDPTVDPSNGAVDNDDLEFHLVFHDAPGPEMTSNFPPPFSFFYHLVFEDVSVEIR